MTENSDDTDDSPSTQSDVDSDVEFHRSTLPDLLKSDGGSDPQDDLLGEDLLGHSILGAGGQIIPPEPKSTGILGTNYLGKQRLGGGQNLGDIGGGDDGDDGDGGWGDGGDGDEDGDNDGPGIPRREDPEWEDVYDDVLETITPEGPDTPAERLEDHMKPVWNTGKTREGQISLWRGLIETLASEFDDFIQARNDALFASFVDTAVGKELDKIGKFVQTPRRTDETDEHYRPRLKVSMRRLISSGTIEDIKQTSAILLDADEGQIKVSEDFSTEPARFTLSVPDDLLNRAGVSVSDYREFIAEIKAAGVRMVATSQGSFEHRTESEFMNGNTVPEKGYDTLGDDGNPVGVGGKYRTLI